MKVVSYACYLDKDEWTPNHRRIVKVLQSSYDHVFVPYATKSGHSIEIIDTSVMCMHQANHIMQDFALHAASWSSWTSLDEIDEVLLVNDSFELLRPNDFQSILTKAVEPGLHGLTKSWESSGPYPRKISSHDTEHLQSYYVRCKGSCAIKDLSNFFEQYLTMESMDAFESLYSGSKASILHGRNALVDQYEIGLSRFMRARGHVLHAEYPHERVSLYGPRGPVIANTINLTYQYWDLLILAGCPVVKYKRNLRRRPESWLREWRS